MEVNLEKESWWSEGCGGMQITHKSPLVKLRRWARIERQRQTKPWRTKLVSAAKRDVVFWIPLAEKSMLIREK